MMSRSLIAAPSRAMRRSTALTRPDSFGAGPFTKPTEASTAAWGAVTTGGPAWHFSATPERWFGTPFPGQHDAELLAELEAARVAEPESVQQDG